MYIVSVKKIIMIELYVIYCSIVYYHFKLCLSVYLSTKAIWFLKKNGEREMANFPGSSTFINSKKKSELLHPRYELVKQWYIVDIWKFFLLNGVRRLSK